MPIYEYFCKTCGIIEVIQAASDASVKICPDCGEVVEKMFSLTAKPQFKGEGFYETDYKVAKKPQVNK